jgi:hypothetical protein
MKSNDYRRTDRVYHHIHKGEARLIRPLPRRLPLVKQMNVGKMLKHIQQLGFIEVKTAPGHPLSFLCGRRMGTCTCVWITGN